VFVGAVGGVPSKIMVDNLKSAVLQRLAGAAPVFNPRYLDCARHHGFAIEACNVARGNEKGRVESGVGYVKKNFLHGLELTDFSTIQAAAQVWLDTIANVRIHGETQQRPVDLLAQERPHLGPLNPHPYDLAHTSTSVASSQFRITLDTNQAARRLWWRTLGSGFGCGAGANAAAARPIASGHSES
jgi:hypothetical protein